MQADVNNPDDKFPQTSKKRTLGTLRGKIQVLDPNWWKPMTDAEVNDFLAGDDYPAAQ